MNRKELNEYYKSLDDKAKGILLKLKNQGIACDMGYYNGHYTKDEEGEYQLDFFPIPVIGVKGLCDIEISSDGISVSSKLSRQQALEFNYDRIMDLAFEAYGIDDYLTDFYNRDFTISQMLENIKHTQEAQIGFSFSLGLDMPIEDLYEFICFLKINGFYY